MNGGFLYFIIGVVTSLAKAKSYSLPYDEASGKCRDGLAEYLVENSRCCSKCLPGTRLIRSCTSTRDTECQPCPAGMYSDSWNYYPNCFICSKCSEDKGMEYAKQCTRESNAVCVCKPGYYCSDPDEPSCNLCERHSTCPPGKGAVQPGTTTRNVKCGKCPEGTFSREASTQPCRQHTRCDLQGRSVLRPGTDRSDTECGPVVFTLTEIPPPTLVPMTSASPEEASTIPSTPAPRNASRSPVPARSPRPPDHEVFRFWIGLGVAVLLAVLLIAAAAAAAFRLHHRKAPGKPPVHDAVEAGQRSLVAQDSSPTEKQGLLADNSSRDPSTSSSSSDSHSQGTGVSQDCLHMEPPSVSSPVLNLSITATFNCQVNPATGSCSIPISPCVLPAEPEFPLSQEEELCVACEQEDSKDAIQSVQESGMTKY